MSPQSEVERRKPRAKSGRIAVLSGQLWRHPEFVKLWVGSSISSLGSQVTILAVPLAAVLLFQAGPAETGILTALGLAPTLLFSLLAGVWVDRLPRRPIRIVADVLNAVIIGSIPLAASLNALSLQHLYVATFLAGCCTVWSRISVSAMLPDLVGRENLVEANGKTVVTRSMAAIAGPSLAGVLVQLLSAPLALIADAASFLVSAVCIWRVKLDEPQRKAIVRKSLWHEVVDGLVWLRHEPILLRLTLSIGLANVALFGVQAIIVVYATRDIGMTPAMLGLALGLVGPGSLAGALVAGYFAQRFGLGPILIVSLSGELLSRIVLVLAAGPPLMAAVTIGISQLIFGFIAPLWDVNSQTLQQSATPPRMLGRVTAASAMIGVGTAPIGALLAGWIGQVAGARVALLEAMLVTFLSVVVLVRSPVPRLRDASRYLAERAPEVSQILS